MNLEIIRCAICNIPLSVPVRERQNREGLCHEMGCDYIEPGVYVVADECFATHADGHLVINLKDAINTKHHWDRRRLSGCCGIGGMDGPNTLCLNDHEIGAEYSDCWMPHGLAFDPNCAVLETLNENSEQEIKS